MTIPDLAQRTRALDPRNSFIVQAPAGSGKTELLIQRHLTLLSEVEEAESVIAITFTRKAAGEMSRRIMNALAHAAGPRPEKPHEALTWDLAHGVREKSQKLGWDLFRNPKRLRIQTIDSLCASLVRKMPCLSRMGGVPNIVEDARELYAEAARRAIELVEREAWSEDVGVLLIHLDNNFQVLQQLLATMLARRDQWLRHITGAADAAQSRAALETAFRNVILDSIDKARTAIPEELSLEIAAVAAAAGTNLLLERRAGQAAACVGQTRLPDPDRVEAWLGIADTLLTREGHWRRALTVANGFPPTTAGRALKQCCLELIAALSADDHLRVALAELRLLPDAKFAEPQWRVLKALVRMLPAAAEELRGVFREQGSVDFVELGIAARRAMSDSGQPESGIKHLLVDEFQDTSVSQYALLETLTAGWERGDGRTIFAVGDPMQSIYRFREAEVGLFFKACRDGIGGVLLEPLRLSANFRSDEGIVNWVNTTFPDVLASEEDMTTGAVPFCRSDAVKAPADGAAATLHPFIGRNDEVEAAKVVGLIRSAQARGQSRIAILVRARSHLARILPALRAAGLTFRAVEIDSLADAPMVQDLTALTRALAHPGDRIAWLALLRAPWCGLTLHELHVLAADDLKSALWDLIRDESRLMRLSPEARSRLHRVRSVLDVAFAHRPFSLRAWVEGVWLALGGPACTAGSVEIEHAKAFFDLLEEMEQGGSVDFAALQRRIQNLYANPDSAANESLQIMTIHKAKGLEFDTVIAPGLGRKPKSDDARLMFWLERPRLGGRSDLLLAPVHAIGSDRDSIYDYLKRIDALKSSNELGRLLYVAATRAKSELHLLGHVGYGSSEGGLELKKPEAGSLLERLWGTAEPVFQEALRDSPMLPSSESAAVPRAPHAIRRLSPDWRMPPPPPRVTVEGEAARRESDPGAVSFHWVADTLRHIGTVVHQMLRHMAETGINRWHVSDLHRRRPAYSSALASLGVPPEELAQAVDRVEAALTRTLCDDRGIWVLGSHHRNTACEYALSGIVAGELVSARIDRTFVDEQGTRWVIDYKSSAHEGAGLEAFLDNERERYREQLARYRSLFAAMEDRPVRAGLYFPLLNAWREFD